MNGKDVGPPLRRRRPPLRFLPLRANGTRWRPSRGTWRAAALSIALTLASAAGKAQSLEGDWYGTLQPPHGPALRLVLHVRKHGPDGYGGTLDSLDQRVRGIQVGRVFADGSKLAIDAPDISAHFRAIWDPGRQRWTGHWDQGIVLPLDMARSPTVTAIRRPQTPQPPYPYRVEDVIYDNAAAGVRLAGTLTRPPGTGPFPAALLIAGSGPSDRDEAVFGHKPFMVLADALTRRGIAVLRVDKRGVGRSTGHADDATTRDFADDVRAGLIYLRHRSDIDAARVGLIGHSEGGLIAPMVAGGDPAVAFVVLLAAPGLRGDALLLAQARLTAADLGLSDASIAAASAVDAKIFAAVEASHDPEQARNHVREILLSDARLGTADATIEAKARQAGSLWFMYFLSYDPVPALAQLRCPVLAVAGSNDHQVPARENLASIRRALSADHDVTVVEMPRLNHMLQTSTTGSVLEYAAIEETMAPAALALLGEWIGKRTGR